VEFSTIVIIALCLMLVTALLIWHAHVRHENGVAPRRELVKELAERIEATLVAHPELRSTEANISGSVDHSAYLSQVSFEREGYPTRTLKVELESHDHGDEYGRSALLDGKLSVNGTGERYFVTYEWEESHVQFHSKRGLITEYFIGTVRDEHEWTPGKPQDA